MSRVQIELDGTTFRYAVAMRTQPLSIRFDPGLLDRLRRRARSAETTPSALAQQLVEEGMRMREHPGIVFRDGPAGRRAGLAAGPDVWEVIAVVRQQTGRGDGAVESAAQELGLSVHQVRAAVAYYAAHEDEILARVEDNERAALEAVAAWEAQRRLLA
jgi:hypothetical protein